MEEGKENMENNAFLAMPVLGTSKGEGAAKGGP